MGQRDAQRIEEEIAGVDRVARPPSLSGSYLQQAVDALHAAGDPGHLYRQWRAAMPPAPFGREFMRRWGREERFRRSYTCVIFAAFAAEAYVNEFLAAFDLARVAELDRMSTIRKYTEGTAEAYGERLFWDGDEAMPTLSKLFALRHRLAHPKPGLGSPALFEPDDPELEEVFALPQLAEYVVMVAGAADVLVWRAYGYLEFDFSARKLWRAREVVRDFGQRRAELPLPDEPDEQPLWAQISDYLATLQPMPDAPDATWTRLREAKAKRSARS